MKLGKEPIIQMIDASEGPVPPPRQTLGAKMNRMPLVATDVGIVR